MMYQEDGNLRIGYAEGCPRFHSDPNSTGKAHSLDRFGNSPQLLFKVDGMGNILVHEVHSKNLVLLEEVSNKYKHRDGKTKHELTRNPTTIERKPQDNSRRSRRT